MSVPGSVWCRDSHHTSTKVELTTAGTSARRDTIAAT
jgi:hypothetical protein